MHKFGYGFLREGYLPASIVQYSMDIGSYSQSEKERRNDFPKAFEKLREKAIVESVKASNEIEQVVTTYERITAIVNGAKPQTHDEEEIAGYSDALNEIHAGYGKMQFGEDTIRHLHEILYSRSYRRLGGMYKAEDNLILQYDGDGNPFVRFRPVPADQCETCMQQLVLAYLDAKQNGIPDLVLIPCVILDFICIHPFSDGNGRISRLLMLLLYCRAGLDIGKYISIENQIMESCEYYYEALQESSEGWDSNQNSYVPFMKYCMYVLAGCYGRLNRQFLTFSGKKGSKSDRVESVILSSIVPISKEEICRQLPDVSTATVQGNLNRLIKAGRIMKIGTYRNARYVRK